MDTIGGPMFYGVMGVLFLLAAFVIVSIAIEQAQEWRARWRAKRDLARLDRWVTAADDDGGQEYERYLQRPAQRAVLPFMPPLTVEEIFGLWQPPSAPTYPGDAPAPLWEQEFDEIVRARMWGE